MSVAEDLRDYLIGGGLCNQADITISRTPTVNLTGDNQWVVVAEPGSKSGGNILQWKRKHNVAIAYRNKSGEVLYSKDDELQALLEQCVALEHYKVLQVVCNPMGELPLGTTEAHVGQWQVTLELVTK